MNNDNPTPEFFCTTHNRAATHTDAKGSPCCDPTLPGITMPCRVSPEPVTPPPPPPPTMAALTPDCNHAVVGISVHPTNPPRFVYSLPALVEREAFTNPSCPDPYQAVWAMVTDLVATHGDAAPVFLDDAAAREARQKTVITNFGRKIIVP